MGTHTQIWIHILYMACMCTHSHTHTYTYIPHKIIGTVQGQFTLILVSLSLPMDYISETLGWLQFCVYCRQTFIYEIQSLVFLYLNKVYSSENAAMIQGRLIKSEYFPLQSVCVSAAFPLHRCCNLTGPLCHSVETKCVSLWREQHVRPWKDGAVSLVLAFDPKSDMFKRPTLTERELCQFYRVLCHIRRAQKMLCLPFVQLSWKVARG